MKLPLGRWPAAVGSAVVVLVVLLLEVYREGVLLLELADLRLLL